MKSVSTLALALAIAGVLSGAAAAQGVGELEQYVSGSAGFNFQTDSDNDGVFTDDFVTGDGVAVPAGTTLPAGTDLGWTTEFDTGLFLAGAYGVRINERFRVEGEISYTSADVDTHTGVEAGGAALGPADTAVLLTGSAPLGVTVAETVADGQGDITSVGYALNGYYDFPIQGTAFTVYGGAGIGIAEVDVDYSPSDVQIVDDTEMVGFYQLMAGGSYGFSDNVEFFTGYRFRQSEDAKTDSVLVPASLDIENQQHILEAGVRYTF